MDQSDVINARNNFKISQEKVGNIPEKAEMSSVEDVKRAINHRIKRVLEHQNRPLQFSYPIDDILRKIDQSFEVKNTPTCTYAVVVQFLTQLLPTLQLLKSKTCARWMRFCVDSKSTERMGPLFSRCTNIINTAYHDAASRWEVLSFNIQTKQSSQLWHGGLGGKDLGGRGLGGLLELPFGHSSWFSLDHHIEKGDTGENPTLGFGEAGLWATEELMKGDVQQLRTQDVGLYTQWVIPAHESLKNIRRFVVQIKWLMEDDQLRELGTDPKEIRSYDSSDVLLPNVASTWREIDEALRSLRSTTSFGDHKHSTLGDRRFRAQLDHTEFEVDEGDGTSYTYMDLLSDFSAYFKEKINKNKIVPYDQLKRSAVQEVDEQQESSIEKGAENPQDLKQDLGASADGIKNLNDNSSADAIQNSNDNSAEPTIQQPNLTPSSPGKETTQRMTLPVKPRGPAMKPLAGRSRDLAPLGEDSSPSPTAKSILSPSSSSSKLVEYAKDDGSDVEDEATADPEKPDEDTTFRRTRFAFSEAQPLEIPVSSIKDDNVMGRESHTYLKSSKEWLHSARIAPEIPEWLSYQRLQLRQVKHYDRQLEKVVELLRIDDEETALTQLGKWAEELATSIPDQNNSIYDGDHGKEQHSDDHVEQKQQGNEENYISDVLEASVKVSMDLPIHRIQSVFMLRFLRIQNLKDQLLGILNYFRSVQREVVLDDLRYYRKHADITDIVAWVQDSFAEPGDVHYTVLDGKVVVEDSEVNVPIVYDVAVEDLKAIETELLQIASIFIGRSTNKTTNTRSQSNVNLSTSITASTLSHSVSDGKSSLADQLPSADCWAILLDLFEKEVEYQTSKCKVFDAVLEAYRHTIEVQKQRDLGQRLLNLMVARPRLDLNRPARSYAPNFMAEIFLYHRLSELLRTVLETQRLEEVQMNCFNRDWQQAVAEHNTKASMRVHLSVNSGLSAIGVFEFFPSFKCVEDILEALQLVFLETLGCTDEAVTVMKQARIIDIETKIVSRCFEIFLDIQKQQSPFLDAPSASVVNAMEESFVLNDPCVAMSTVEMQTKKLEQTKKKKGEASDISEDEVAIASNLLEILHLRKQLLDWLYECTLLSSIYSRQAAAIGIEVPFTLVDISSTQATPLCSTKQQEVGLLAINECLKYTAKSLNKHLPDIAGLISNRSPPLLQTLRVATAVQLTHLTILSTAVEFHACLMRLQHPDDIARTLKRLGGRKPKSNYFEGMEKSVVLPDHDDDVPSGASKSPTTSNQSISWGGTSARAKHRADSSTIQVGILSKLNFVNIASMKAKIRRKIDSLDDVIPLYCKGVLDSLVVQVYTIEMYNLHNRFRDLHATKFGIYSPFQNNKVQPSFYDRYVDMSFESTTVQTLQNEGVFESIFQLPDPLPLSHLWERSATEDLKCDVLKADLECRKSLLDISLLELSLAKCQNLELTGGPSSRMAEVTAEHLMYVQEQMKNLPALSGWASILEYLANERAIVWDRINMFLRLLTETVTAKDDSNGYEVCRYASILLLADAQKRTRDKKTTGGPNFRNTNLCLFHSLSSIFVYWRTLEKQASLSTVIFREVSLFGRMWQKRIRSLAPTLEADGRAKQLRQHLTNSLVIGSLFDAHYGFCLNQLIEGIAFTPQGGLSFASGMPACGFNYTIPAISSAQAYHSALEMMESSVVVKANQRSLGIVPGSQKKQENGRPITPAMAIPSPTKKFSSYSRMSVYKQMKVKDEDGRLDEKGLNAGDISDIGVDGLGNDQLERVPVAEARLIFFALSLGSEQQAEVIGTMLEEYESMLQQTVCVEYRRRVDSIRVGLQGEDDSRLNSAVQTPARRDESKYKPDKSPFERPQADSQLTEKKSESVREAKIKESFEVLFADLRNSKQDLRAIQSTAENEAESTYVVVKEELLESILSSLARGLLAWNQTEKQSRLSSMLVHDYMKHLAEKTEKACEQIRLKRAKEAKEALTDLPLFRKTQAEYEVVHELQLLRQECASLDQLLQSQEFRVREEVKAKYEARIYKLAMDIVHTRHKLKVAKMGMRRQVELHYYDIRKTTLGEMVQSGNAPYNLKRKILKDIAEADRVVKKKSEAFDYKQTMQRTQTLFQLKQLISKRAFDSNMRAVVSKMNVFAELLERVRHSTDRLRVLKAELANNKNNLQRVHASTAMLQHELELSRRENSKVLQWKKSQSSKMEKVEIDAKKFDMLEGIDFERLEMELMKKKEVHERAQLRQQNQERRKKLTIELNAKKLTSIQKAINREKSLTREIRRKVEKIREEEKLFRGEDEHQQKWEDAATAVEQNFTRLLKENEKLRLAIQHKTRTMSGTSHGSTEVLELVSQLDGTRPLTVHHSPRPPSYTMPSIPNVTTPLDRGRHVDTSHSTRVRTASPLPPGLSSFLSRSRPITVPTASPLVLSNSTEPAGLVGANLLGTGGNEK